ncbi:MULTISPECIES: DUF6541 family protein [Microbacterium]|uniref:DUF6541 family protein n=1 Tax=Microbacterium TaxID=33882 RepID=UPI00146D29ED|nr:MULTISPECIES: DUF6541 family protein [Microbacterium]
MTPGAWLDAAPSLLAALGVVLVPGLVVGAGLRLRGLALWALAPLGSTALLGGLAIAYGAVGIPWTPWAVGLGVLVVAVVAWFAGRWLGRRPPAHPHDVRARWLLAAGIAIGVTFTAARFIVYVQDPQAISQTNDAVFHLNGIRYILDTGSASSLQMSGVVGGRGFYPSAWHALASMAAMTSGAAIPVAANMVTLVIVALVWPLGIAWFTHQAAHPWVAPAAIAAALAGSMHVFPMLMVQWGVLYPYALSVALLPAAAGVVVAAPRWIRGEGPLEDGRPAAVLVGILLLASAAALALSQPSTLLAWAIIGMSSLIWWAVHHRKGDRRHRLRVTVLIALAGGIFVGLWFALARSTTGSHWPPFRGKLQVVADILLNGHVLLPPAVGVGILTFIGLIVSARRRSLRWLATAWVILTFLYFVVAAVGQPFVRRWLLGAWYADPYRIAALLPVTALPLAAIGLTAVAIWATTAISGREGRDAERFATRWALVVVGVLMAVWFAVAPVIQMGAITQGTFDAESRYATEEYLSDDERALLERLDESVGQDERVIGNPSTGTGFGYTLSGRDVFPRTWSHPASAEWRTIQDGLRDAARDAEVCAALEAYGSPDFVLDFGDGDPLPGRYELPGMSDFAGQPGFELVDREGEASLWRITACS